MSTSLDVQRSEVDADDVDGSRSAACWSVEERGWKQVLPELPDDIIALLATPVVVCAEALGGPAPAPAARPTQAASPPVPAQPVDRDTRFVSPAPPKRRRGKHRRPATVAR